jgi:hypothetical protein
MAICRRRSADKRRRPKREFEARYSAHDQSVAHNICAVVEAVHSFPGQGVARPFASGKAAGGIEATIKVLGIPLVKVASAKVEGYFGLKGSDKEPSRQMALHRFRTSLISSNASSIMGALKQR